ncbi:MAG: prolipoprotein diacylglyceryl transferase [Firmicutes bacterium]|nr:prolipoprotein diacylglyceryl transferase [Bacillota bacterium]
MHPILLDYHGMKVYSYGVMMIVGFFFVLWFCWKYAPKVKMDRSDAIDMTIYTFVFGILGARFIYILLNWGEYAGHMERMFEFQKGGLSWHGGILGGIGATLIFCYIKKYNIWKGLDLITTPSIAALAFGRVGCFLNGCCYGVTTNLPWAMVFPHHRHPVPVHPTQIYELILDLILFAYLVIRWNKRRFNGEQSLLMLSYYSLIRFIVEFFRYNTPDQMVSGLSYAQWASLLFFAIFMGMALLIGRKYSKLPPVEEREKDDNSKNKNTENSIDSALPEKS